MGYAIGVLYALGVVLTSLWVARDAKKNRIPTYGNEYGLATGAVAWFFECVLFWFLYVPAYFIRRSRVLHERPKNFAVNEETRSAKEGPCRSQPTEVWLPKLPSAPASPEPPPRRFRGPGLEAEAAGRRKSQFLKGSPRLFRVAGTDVFLHWSWLIVALFLFLGPAEDVPSLAWRALVFVAVFGIVLLHEFGHVLACRQVGGRADRIVLWLLGGIAFSTPPPRPGALLWTVAAGPMVNVALAPVFFGLMWLAAYVGWAGLSQFLLVVLIIDIGLLVFNLLPIYPLDGAQFLQAILWFFIGQAGSLIVFTVIGLVAGVGAIIFALATHVWRDAAMAVLVVVCSLNGLVRAIQILTLRKVPGREGLACPCCGKAPPRGRFWYCDRCHQLFDLFDDEAMCPRCSTRHVQGQCYNCTLTHAVADWFPKPAGVPLEGVKPGSGEMLAEAARSLAGRDCQRGCPYEANLAE